MAFLESSDIPKPRVSPELFVGVASPLWSYFGAAAAGGVAFWWMTRWTRPVNLEALFDQTLKAMTPVPAAEPVIEAFEKVAAAAAEVIEAATPPVPEPILEAEPASAPEPMPKPPAEATFEPAPSPKPVVAAAPEPAPEEATAPKPKVKKPDA